jgi:hypothetical protein
MRFDHLMLAAVATAVLSSSAVAAPSTFMPIIDHGPSGKHPIPIVALAHGPSSKDHTPVLEQCSAYEDQFSKAVATQPASSPKVVEAKRLEREGIRMCNREETKATQGANELAEALHMIGVQPRL